MPSFTCARIDFGLPSMIGSFLHFHQLLLPNREQNHLASSLHYADSPTVELF